MTAIPQDAALDLQLAACAGDEPNGSYRELRHRTGSLGAMRQTWLRIHDHKGARHAVAELAALGDVYFGVQPRAHRAGGAAAVERCWTLHVDCDTAAAVQRAHSYEPLAAVMVASGSGGLHAYWPLRAPL